MANSTGCPTCGAASYIFINDNGLLRMKCPAGHVYYTGKMEHAGIDSELTREFIVDTIKDPNNHSWDDRVKPAKTESELEREYELRAAFGEGAEVMNVLTGQRFRT
jgi:hypothetical protein